MSFTRNRHKKIFDLVGVGIGPFNLSLAALLKKNSSITAVFLEKLKKFSWHENMLLDNAKLQVHYLKDLVTLADPTHELSFLSYLKASGRIYQFINRKSTVISRAEFNDYYLWAVKSLNNLVFNSHVHRIEYDGDMFTVFTDQDKFFSKHIVIGTGTTPYLPELMKHSFCETVFHSSDYKLFKSKFSFHQKKIVLIGGGQSGAEIFDDIISQKELPSSLSWIIKRGGLNLLENSCFSNEFYSPSYVSYFSGLSNDLKEKKLFEQKFTSDGISEALSDIIYNKIYELRFVKKAQLLPSLLVNAEVFKVEHREQDHNVHVLAKDFNKKIELPCDIIIFATGYQYKIPKFLENIFPGIDGLEQLVINNDYSIQFKSGTKNKIFVQNGARHHFGIADSNLSLSSQRSAVIVNSLLGKEKYPCHLDNPIINFTIIEK